MRDEDDLVFRKACRLLKPYNVQNVSLSKDTDIARDLEIDSVAVLDLIMEVEDDYRISIPMNMLSDIRTIGDLVQTIHEQARGA